MSSHALLYIEYEGDIKAGVIILRRRISSCWFLQGSQLFLAIKFKVLSRFYPGQKGHSPGISTDNICCKKTRSHRRSKIEYKTWKKLFQFNIEMLCIFNNSGFIHVFCSFSFFVQVFLMFWEYFRLFLDLGR